MTSNQKSQFYLEMIKRSHESFRDFLVHLPEDILDWKAHELMYTPAWIIEHLIHDQIWISHIVQKSDEEGYPFDKESQDLSLDDLIEEFDNMVSEIEMEFANIEDNQLTELRDYKGYEISVEDWIFEYINHILNHGGELGYILTAWKRKNRSQ